MGLSDGCDDGLLAVVEERGEWRYADRDVALNNSFIHNTRPVSCLATFSSFPVSVRHRFGSILLPLEVTDKSLTSLPGCVPPLV